jgi:CrcB protein
MINVGLGSAIGALLRYLLTSCWKKRGINWPLATLLINVTGSLALGLLTSHFAADSPVMLLFGIGMMGGYTTFSTFNTELISMIDEHRWVALLTYLGLSYILGIGAAVIGMAL